MVHLTAMVLLGGMAIQSRHIPISDLPCDRITGVARQGNSWLVGGIRGLFLGEPGGEWRQSTDQSVRQMATGRDGTWVVYGSGNLDKVDIKADRRYNDVLRGVSKRPWVSSIFLYRDGVLLGGSGGYQRREKSELREFYSPELVAQPITAIAKFGKDIWLGTQVGLYCQSKDGLSRLGFGSGLPDVWITAIESSSSGIVTGLAAGGLARVENGKATKIDSPTPRVRYLDRWHRSLIVGGLEGAWMRKGDQWEQLTNEETTFITQVGSELIVGTPSGINFYRWNG